MSRHKSLIPLSHDHHHGLVLAQLLKKNAPQYKNLPNSFEGKVTYLLNAYKTDLLHHFKKEEKILYPFVRGKDEELEKLFKEIVNEHKKIAKLVEDIQNGLSNADVLDSLGTLLEEHIRKEERQLFRMIENILSGNELEKLNELLNSEN